MNERDLLRVQRIMMAHERGSLTDLTVVAILAAVRAEAVLEERAKEVRRLEARGLKYLVRGERELADAFEATADEIDLRAPREYLHA